MRRKLGIFVVTVLAVCGLISPSVDAAPGPQDRERTPSRDGAGLPAAPVGHTGRWLTDADGRVLLLHGVNLVSKRAPYVPDTVGFDDDDAAFLARNGLNTVRLGIIWKAVEPQPGRYDDAYLAHIAKTVRTLAAHGIVTLLDAHQDMYHEKFQGEGAPDWAVRDDGLPNWPQAGFPTNYFANPALARAYDNFWANVAGPGDVGLQDRYAAMWRHIASYFRDTPGVLGYDLFNEPGAGSSYPHCLVPGIGCPQFDARLTTFTKRVTSAIRASDPKTLVFSEPNMFFNAGLPDSTGPTGDPHAALSFHDYCPTAAVFGNNAGCGPFDRAVFDGAQAHSDRTGDGLLLTEFGATDNLEIISATVERAEANQVGWMYWAYCDCADPTTTGGGGEQALVRDPSAPPQGDNVKRDKLATLAVPHPQTIAGTPSSYGYDRAKHTFTLSYTPTRVDGAGSFAPGAVSTIAVPRTQYPHGYHAHARGARVISRPGEDTVRLAANPGASQVTVTIQP